MKKSLLILMILCMFAACNQSKTRTSRYTSEQIASLHLDSTTILSAETDSIITIDVNPFLKRQLFIDFDTLVNDIKLIPLETTDESLLDDIRKIIITDNHIYIYDALKGGGLAVFDRNGKFIKRMSYGQGPGDIARLYDISFDEENNELVAYMHSFLMFFTPSGEFIRKERLPFGFYNFTVIPDGYIVKTCGRQGNDHLQNLQDYTLFVTDKKFKLKFAEMYEKPCELNYGGRNFIYSNKSRIYITQDFTDTVYWYEHETSRLKALYALDYRKKIPKRYLEGSFKEFEDAIKQNDYYFYIGEYMDALSHHAFRFNNWHTGAAIVFRDKKSGNMSGGTGMRYSKIPPVLSIFPVASTGDYFVTYHLPSISDTIISYTTGISDEEKAKLKGLTEDDNPVLVLFKLNDF